jgi:plastocyanin
MQRRTVLASLGGLAAFSLAGCTALGDSDSAGEYDVGMSSRRFLPGYLEVEAGTTVVWKNTSSRAHTVTAYESQIPADAAYFATGEYDSQKAAVDAWFARGGGGIYGDETYSHTFEVPGEYRYYCIPHEASGMIGTVNVTD